MNHVIYDGTEYRIYNHLWAVARDGRLLRKFLPYNKAIIRPDDYVSVGRQNLLHRLVATCWIDRPEGANHIHHIDGNKANNHADNLMWVTPKHHYSTFHRDINQGRTKSPETIEKWLKSREGWKHSESSKKKIRESSISRGCKPPSWSGKTHTPETIAKMQASASHRKCPCEINGIHYDSFKAAGKVLGISRLAIRQRCHSPNFPDYHLLTDTAPLVPLS